MKKKQNSTSGYLSSITYRNGPTGVLLVHSLGGTPMEMKFVAQALSRAGYTVRVPMLPGLTNGTDVLSLSRWQDWLDAIEAEFDELKQECDTILVGGLSAGAILSMRLAQKRQDEIAGIIALAPTLFPNGWAVPWTLNLFRLVKTRWTGRMFRFAQRAPYGIKDERIRNFVIDAFRSERRSLEDFYSRSGVTVLEFLRLSKTVQRSLPSLKLPTLIVHPREDDQSSIDNALKLQRRLGGPVEAIILDDCYHIVTLDRQRDVVVDRTLDFVARLLARRAPRVAAVTGQKSDKTKSVQQTGSE